MADLKTYLDDRYGRHKSPYAGVLKVGLALVMAAAVAWLLYAAWASTPPLDAGITSYNVVSDHELHIKVSYRADAGVDGRCQFRATSADHNVVGERSISLQELREAGGDWLVIRTERRATMVELLGCSTS